MNACTKWQQAAPLPAMSRAAVVIGRFQPYHLGHRSLINAALDSSEQVVIVLGSAFAAASSKNPWHIGERQAMFEAVHPSERHRLHPLPIRDYFDLDRWCSTLRRALAHIDEVVLLGHHKDSSSVYLQHFPEWTRRELPLLLPIDASRLRQSLWLTPASTPLPELWQRYTHSAVRQLIDDWRQQALFRRLADEAAHRLASQPTLSKPLALHLADQAVWLTQHSGGIGHGLWRLPEARPTETNTTERHRFERRPGSAYGLSSREIWRYNHGSNRNPIDATGKWIDVVHLPAIESQLVDEHAVMLDRCLGLAMP